MLTLSSPLDEAINIIIEKLFSENETVHNLNKDQFKYLLTLATKESYFLFDGELYQQVDSVAMGSPLGPSLANIFFAIMRIITNFMWTIFLFFLSRKPKLNRSKISSTLVILKLNLHSKKNRTIVSIF